MKNKKNNKRISKVFFIFLKMFFDFRKDFKLIKKKGFKYAERKMFNIHKKRATELYNIAIELGGVLIKLCQYFSTRRDMFPEPYIQILSNLQDNVPPVPFEEIYKIIQNEYKNINFPFKNIDENAIASASLGQVHKAITIDNKEVVLKILKPHIEEIVDYDFAILFYIFKFFSNFKFFRERTDFINILEEFITVTGDELNFLREVHNLKRLKKGLEKFDYVKIPEVYEKYCTRKIIVMEYIKGDKISEIDKWIKRNNDPKIISKRLVEVYFEQFLFIRVIHFDPHPGNILVLDNNNFVLLDFGMSGEITENMSKNIKESLKALSKKDYKKIIKILINLGFLKDDVEIKNLYPIIEFFFEEVMDSIQLEKESLFNIDFSPIIDDMIEIIYTQPFRLPYEWAFIGRTIGTLVGIISLIYPQFQIYRELEPYFRKVLEQNFNEILNSSIESAKFFIKNSYDLPYNFNNFIDKVEKGTFKFRIDEEELDTRIDNIKTFIVKLTSIGVCFFSTMFTYGLYLIDNKGYIFFGSISILSISIFLFYKKKSKKDIIKDQILKEFK